ncbi:unnamed protein product [Cochlearia groenlandica]
MKHERLREESQARIDRLKRYLDKNEAKKTTYLLCNHIKGIFDVFEKIESEHVVVIPDSLVVTVHAKEKGVYTMALLSVKGVICDFRL